MRKELRATFDGKKGPPVSAMRSAAMAAVRGKHNKTTEVRLRMALVQAGIGGWRLHAKDVAGKPDFYFKRERLAVFVDGCFWHFCPKCGRIPKTRSAYWKLKFEYNVARDRRVKAELRRAKVRMLRIWEHELKPLQGPQRAVARIGKTLSQLAEKRKLVR